MQKFEFNKTTLEDAYLIKPFRVEDERGFFKKKFEKDVFLENGIEFEVNEIFVSESQKGTLRGLHHQTKDPQAKLVSVDAGEILDIIVDIRKDSKTYLKWESFKLSSTNHDQLYVPKGFIHGFLTLSNTALVSYTCHGKFLAEYDNGYRYDDIAFNIDWQLDLIGGEQNLIVSQKDLNFDLYKEI